MKLYIKQKSLIIVSETLISILGWLSSGKYGYKHTKAAACFPFIIVRKRETLTPLLLNHERIHHYQQLETLYIGLWLLSLLEYVYARLVLGLTPQECYFYQASEQEAHLHQVDLTYLQTRKTFSIFKYVLNKKQFSYVESKEPEVRVL